MRSFFLKKFVFYKFLPLISNKHDFTCQEWNEELENELAEAQLEYDETKEDKQMEYEEQLKKVALKLLSQSFDIASFSYSYFKLKCDLDRLRCQSIHSCVRMSDMTASASEHRFSFKC